MPAAVKPAPIDAAFSAEIKRPPGGDSNLCDRGIGRDADLGRFAIGKDGP